MANPTIRFKRGTQSAFGSVGLQTGEPAYITDEYNFYIGEDGTNGNNRFLGSARYWTKETTTVGSSVKVVEGTNNGTNSIALKAPNTLASDLTYTLPGTDGSSGDVLVTDGSGNLSFSSTAAASLDIAGDSGTDSVSVGSDTLTFTGGEGIDTTITDNTVTIAAEIASSTNAGVASFSAYYFSVTAGGAVSIGDAAADGSTKGIAAFDADDFDASSGVISLGDSANGAVIAINGTTNEVEVSRSNGTVTVGLPDDVTVGGGLTATTFTLAGIAVTAILDEDGMNSDRADALATQQSIKAYVDSQVTAQDLDIAGDSGSGAVDLDSQSLTIAGTANEIVTSASGQTLTIGLPDNVTIGDSLTITNNASVGGGLTVTGAVDFNGGIDISGGETTLSSATVSDLTATRVVLAGTAGALEDSANLTYSGNGLTVGAGGINVTGVSTFSTDVTVTGDLQVSGNDIKDGGGTAAITFDGSGNTTITGNLNVNGSTTQVNTASLTIEDQLIELGRVDGSAPSSDLNKDIGTLLHYYDTAARLGGIYWDDSVSRIVLASRVSEAAGVLTVESGYYAPVEIGELFVTDTAGSGEEVIGYATIGGVTGRHLQNINVDGGVF